MAIDTRNKRASVIGLVLAAAIYPNPDGTLASVADRQQCARAYANGLAQSVIDVPRIVTGGGRPRVFGDGDRTVRGGGRGTVFGGT